jgi:magnesium transporter
VGLITCFGFGPEGNITVDALDEVERLAPQPSLRLWVDLEDPTEDELARIGKIFGLDSEALEDCIEGEQRPRVDRFEGYLFVLMYGVVGDNETSTAEPRKLGIFYSDRAIVSVHVQSLKTVGYLRRHKAGYGHRLLEKGTDAFLCALFDLLVDNYMLVSEQYFERIEALEEESLHEDVGLELLNEVSEMKRELIGVRHLTAAVREVVLPFSRGEMFELSAELRQQFNHILDHLLKTLDMIDGTRELLNGVRDNYHATLGNRMNAIMKTLTLFATVVLPMTLVAGIYGMNVPLYPGPDSANAFWFLLGGMGVMGAGLLIYFRFKRWL